MMNEASGLVLVLHKQDFVAHLLFVITSCIFMLQTKQSQYGIQNLPPEYLFPLLQVDISIFVCFLLIIQYFIFSVSLKAKYLIRTVWSHPYATDVL